MYVAVFSKPCDLHVLSAHDISQWMSAITVLIDAGPAGTADAADHDEL